MDLEIDIGAIYFGLKQIKNIESELNTFKNSMSGITLPAEVTTASLLTKAQEKIAEALTDDIITLIEIFEESKAILQKNDAKAALLFDYYEQGIIDENGNFTEVPLMNQDDYGYIKYSQGTVASSGCGVTSLCMVASYILGELYTPEDLAAIANTNKQSNVGRMLTAAEYVGLNWYNDKNTSINDLRNYLNEGKLVICLVKGSSHFVVCTGVTSDGKIMVNDPYSKYRSDDYADGYTVDELRFSPGKTWVFDPAANTNSKGSAGTISISSSVMQKLQAIEPDGKYNETVRGDKKNNYDAESFSTPGKRYIPNLRNVPTLSQRDERWAGYRMTAGNTINDSGCGYTSVSMILSGLKEEEITPLTITQTLKAEVDTNGDGRADAFFDRNQDGKADLYDALSRSYDGNDGLKLDAIVSSEFQNMFDVNVEQIHVSSRSNYGIQSAMDDGKPCLIGTPAHYVIAVPGNSTYVDAAGVTHRTTVIIDPYFDENTVEIAGEFNYDNLAAAGVTSLDTSKMSVYAFENRSGKAPILETLEQNKTQMETNNSNQAVNLNQTTGNNNTSSQNLSWTSATTNSSTGSYNGTTSSGNYSGGTPSGNHHGATSNGTPSSSTNTTTSNPQQSVKPNTNTNTIIRPSPDSSNKVEVLKPQKPTTSTPIKPSIKDDYNTQITIPKVDHSTSTDEKVLEQLIETMKPTTENTPSMGETIPPKEPSSAQTQDVVIQKPNVPQDTNTIPEPPKTKVDTYQENTINITKDERTAVERLNITKDSFNKKTSSPVVNPALVGTIIAATGIGAVSTISRNQKKKTQK